MATALELNRPQPPTQCGGVTITWNLGQPPYTLRITSSDFTETLETLGPVSGRSVDWAVNQPGGTQFGLILRDSTPITVQQGPIEILPGSDDSCLGTTPDTTTSSTSSSTPSSTSTTSPHTFSATVDSSVPPTETPTETPTGTSGGSDSITGNPSVSLTESQTGSGAPTAPLSLGSTDSSLSSGAIAGIALGAAVGGIILAALAYMLWRRRRGRARSGGRMLDLNESTLPPAEPPAMSKVEMMRQAQNQPLLGSSSGPSSASPTTVAFAQYPSGVPSTDLYPATPLTARSFSAEGSGAGRVTSGGTTASPQGRSIKSGEIRPESSAIGGSVQESDAGVRLAGGPPPIEVSEAVQDELESGGGGAPVPPPYRRYED